MKLKILITPIITILIIILLIWFVHPQYSNGVNGVKDEYAQLKQYREKILSIDNMQKKANEISVQINSVSPEKAILYRFIPEKIREEKIIDNLNMLASTYHLGVFDIVVKPLKINNLAQSITKKQTLFPISQKVEVHMKLSGSYNSIKQFFNDLSQLDRYNDVATLKLSKEVSTKSTTNNQIDQSITKIILAEIIIDFNVLDKLQLSDSSFNKTVLPTGNLGTQVISEISQGIKAFSWRLKVNKKGKANPFLP